MRRLPKATLLTMTLALVLLACATTNPPLARSHQELGAQMLREGDYVGAMREILTASELDPDNPTILMNLAVAYRSRGLPGEAEKALRRAIDLDGKNPELHQALGALLLDQGRFGEAVPELELAAKDLRYSTPHFAYTSLGYAWLGKGQPAQAITCFKQALATTPTYLYAHRGLGEAYYRLGRFDEAAASYRNAIADYASDADSHLGLGLAEAKLGHLREAEQALQAAIDVAPGTEAAGRARSYLERLSHGQALEP